MKTNEKDYYEKEKNWDFSNFNFISEKLTNWDMYEVLNLLFLGGTFLIALLAYIDSRINKRK